MSRLIRPAIIRPSMRETFQYGTAGTRNREAWRAYLRDAAPPIAGGAGFTFVRAGGARSTSATWAATPTQGDLLVAGGYSGGSTALTMTSTGWTALTSAIDATTPQSIRMFWKVAGASESTTVTVAGADLVSMVEYTPPGGTILVAENAQAPTSLLSTYTSPTVTPAASDAAVVCAFFGTAQNTGWNTLVVNGSSTGVNSRNAISGGTPSSLLMDLLVASTSGNYNASAHASSGSSTAGAQAIAVFYVPTGSRVKMIV